MNKVLNKYLIKKFLKTLGNFVFVFICIGIILSLFEQIEFFKNLNVDFQLPLVLTLFLIPNMIIKLMPFIIFFATMWYLISAQLNKDLLNLKIFGISNLKITMTLSSVAFIIGILIIVLLTPITSILITKYEETKARYSKDVDHLVSINKNGVWIKEIEDNQVKIINAKKIDGNYLNNVSIQILTEKFTLIERIDAEKVNIENFTWIIKEAKVYEKKDNTFSLNNKNNLSFKSNYNVKKLQSLYKNLDTISFLDLIYDQKKLLQKGYSKNLLLEKFNLFVSLPFFLMIMVVLGSIFTLGTTKRLNNLGYLFLAIIAGVIIFYLKDFSLALGKAGFISSIISIWVPIIAIGLYCSIGVIQINEK